MALEITYFGHSAFLLSDGTRAIALDPFFSGNPLTKQSPKEIECSWIGITHGHEDHVGDAVQIARANGATVVAAFEICNWLSEQGVETSPGNPGGRIETDFGWIAFTQAFHSSSYEGRYMGMPCGLVVHMGGTTLYHCGDTALFSDMKLLGEIYRPDVACIPIGDRFTMGPELASRAAELIAPKVAIPIHYNTWPPIEQDPKKFRPKGIEVKVLKPGERWTVGREAVGAERR